jgi:uncharacterized protein YkwD
MPRPRPRPGGRLGVALLIAAMLAPATPAAGRASPANAELLELLNATRAADGARPLRRDPKLARAARRHSRDMVSHRYFSHDSRTGERFSARIARTGWMRSLERWSVGETLAWGLSDKARPRAIVVAWLASPQHRRILLSPRFHHVGIGVAAGTPFGPGGAGRTYTADFGS